MCVFWFSFQSQRIAGNTRYICRYVASTTHLKGDNCRRHRRKFWPFMRQLRERWETSQWKTVDCNNNIYRVPWVALCSLQWRMKMHIQYCMCNRGGYRMCDGRAGVNNHLQLFETYYLMDYNNVYTTKTLDEFDISWIFCLVLSEQEIHWTSDCSFLY